MDTENPPNFRIENDNQSNLNNLLYARKCDLCGNLRKLFYCKSCIRNGDFSSSYFENYKESFSEKQQKYRNLKNAHKNLEEKFQHLIQKHKLVENLKTSIKQKRNNQELLQKLIKEKQDNISKLQQIKKENHEKNRSMRIILPKYEDKVNELGDYVAEANEKNESRRKNYQELQEELKQLRRNYIGKLVKFIFPISQTVTTSTSLRVLSDSNMSTKSSNDSLLAAELQSEIDEAMRTAYVRGRWVSQQESLSELQYIIVAPSLPSNGDYSACSDWIAQHKEQNMASHAASDLGSSVTQNSIFRISAALTYTTQLVQVLSFYLDVRLPYKINYSDFCKMDTTEQQFQRRVARLNSNILYLCYTQNIKMKNIQATHTLENILKLLNTNISDLGRSGSVSTNERLAESFDALLMSDLDNGDQSDSDDENNLPLEWETVNMVPTEIVHPIPPPTHATQSVAGNLLNAAQQSIASFWRWTK